jgi:hypothetical protein
VSGEALCVKAIFDMIRHNSTLFNAAIDHTAVMTDIEDARPGRAQWDDEMFSSAGMLVIEKRVALRLKPAHKLSRIPQRARRQGTQRGVY